MSTQSRLIIIIVGVILILGGIVAMVVVNKRRQAALTPGQDRSPLATTTVSGQVVDSSNFDPSKITQPATELPTVPTASAAAVLPVEIEKKGVERFAATFAQIYGTYSSDSNYQNIYDVENLVTPALWAKIKPAAPAKPSSVFVGVTTQVLLTKLTAWNGAAATVEIEARRSETRTQTTSFNQKAVATLVKQGDTWRIDTFVWQKL